MINQELGHFESKSRCCYMERRVASIQVVPDLREKVPGSICPRRAIRGRYLRQIGVSGNKLQYFSGVA
jgi:hypothetical protein